MLAHLARWVSVMPLLIVLVADDDATPDVARDLRMSRRTVAIATACAGGFLAFLDTTIVNTAFPDIAASFDDAVPASSPGSSTPTSS